MFASMFLNGHNVRNQSCAESQSSLTIAQLKHFYIKHKAYNTEKQRHSKSREMPLPIYFGLSIHTPTKSEKIICILDSLEISVSYEHVIKLEKMFIFHFMFYQWVADYIYILSASLTSVLIRAVPTSLPSLSLVKFIKLYLILGVK